MRTHWILAKARRGLNGTGWMRAVGLVLLLGCWACSFGADRPARADEAVRLRVLTYNIHHAEGVDGRLDLARIARVIRGVSPDLVALQEVDHQTRRSGQVAQAEELGRLTQMHAIFGRNLDFAGGGYGNALLSRWPIMSSQNQLLPSLDQGEQRGVLQARVQVHGHEIECWVTHLDHRPDDAERRAAVEQINEMAAGIARPILLAGDLNATPGSDVLQRLQRQWQPVNQEPLATFPVVQPRRQIDYILLRPAGRWRLGPVRVLDESVASDHRPLLAEMELLP